MNSSTTSINPKITKAAEELWDYMKMNQALKPVDIIFVLGNRDDRVANYAAELYDKGLSGQMLVSGGIAHQNDLLKSKWADETEADHFAGILIKQGVPSKSILLEPKATNTGENMRFSYELLMKNNMHPRSILIVQKPYMERRTYATFMKQWPGIVDSVIISSPPFSLLNYINKDQPFELVVNIMVGDLQRIVEYPRFGYQIYLEIPQKVLNAYNYLVQSGFNKHLLQR